MGRRSSIMAALVRPVSPGGGSAQGIFLCGQTSQLVVANLGSTGPHSLQLAGLLIGPASGGVCGTRLFHVFCFPGFGCLVIIAKTAPGRGTVAGKADFAVSVDVGSHATTDG